MKEHLTNDKTALQSEISSLSDEKVLVSGVGVDVIDILDTITTRNFDTL